MDGVKPHYTGTMFVEEPLKTLLDWLVLELKKARKEAREATDAAEEATKAVEGMEERVSELEEEVRKLVKEKRLPAFV